ncbi:hypothetical protein AB1207_13570 [Kineococcus endophyticus]|uniref:Uncharacterized protein n=1 Tax=Kineococcus endophyticus TaxID=1181883 RepID=A0ABV3P829_9ACTN
MAGHLLRLPWIESTVIGDVRVIVLLGLRPDIGMGGESKRSRQSH